MPQTKTIAEWSEIAGKWAERYYSKKEKAKPFRFAHLHEEVGEAWKAWREDDLEPRTEKVTKHGVKLVKPEGLPSELADVIFITMALADDFGIDLEAALHKKYEYLAERLSAKEAKKGKR